MAPNTKKRTRQTGHSSKKAKTTPATDASSSSNSGSVQSTQDQGENAREKSDTGNCRGDVSRRGSPSRSTKDSEEFHVVQQYQNLEACLVPLITTTAEFEAEFFRDLAEKKLTGPIALEKRFTFTDVKDLDFHMMRYDGIIDPPYDRYKKKYFDSGKRMLTYAIESPYHWRLMYCTRECITKSIIEKSSDRLLDVNGQPDTYTSESEEGIHGVRADIAFEIQGDHYIDIPDYPPIVVEVGPSSFHKSDAEYWLRNGRSKINLMLTVDLYSTTPDGPIRLDVTKWVEEGGHVKCESTISAEQDETGERKILDSSAQITFFLDCLAPHNDDKTPKNPLLVTLKHEHILEIFEALTVSKSGKDGWPFDEFGLPEAMNDA
ncbi:hypothetical protein AAP_01564 [Ascosphaera apis ARSEF 7405]|uniref:Uncharacterized protein n=1 Tax=Ascosphaera apis ARSEF 7405 TaxID=392613 RepID=A0A168BBJ8_9EURO|nr:hypothetical protein AAP_01564 [Ascosphaera apis ARSEF 7405]